ncbi:MAG: NAD(P)H-dependent oxidoreductase [Candidatus Omnitrophica bacterium]|nr:NAD(P)H-dependent oxidoreductase [Candidatus Omnitrophota bacterium]
MKKLLHIIATPRGEASRTLKVSGVFLAELRKKYPGCTVDTINVSTETLPPLTVKRIDGKFALLMGGDLEGEAARAWKDIITHIERFLAAETYLISTPMWNFGIPYALKHYIDVVVQPKYLFRYSENGPEGLLKNKKMVVITSRGGDYGPDSPARTYDLQEPYLRAVFGFVGITDITFINAQPMDALGPEVERKAIAQAQEAARRLAETW